VTLFGKVALVMLGAAVVGGAAAALSRSGSRQLSGSSRPGVKVVCTGDPFADLDDEDGPKRKFCKWKCVNGGAPAMFRHREPDRADWYAILHRSTKEAGKWQLTTFDKDGPWGDVNRKSCDQALEDGDINPRWWKLEKTADLTHRA